MKTTERNMLIALLLIIYILIVGDDFKGNSIIQNTISVACSIIAPIVVFFVDSFLKNINRVNLCIAYNEGIVAVDFFAAPWKIYYYLIPLACQLGPRSCVAMHSQ